jgi:hypothetical protein
LVAGDVFESRLVEGFSEEELGHGRGGDSDAGIGPSPSPSRRFTSFVDSTSPRLPEKQSWRRTCQRCSDLLFGNVKDDYTRPDPQTAINVTAKWTCKPGDESHLEELMFHLSKGTAEKYKKDIDKIAEPERYFFRGPVSWTIGAYSKFLHLPATYSSQGSNFTQPGGNMSEGTTA